MLDLPKNNTRKSTDQTNRKRHAKKTKQEQERLKKEANAKRHTAYLKREVEIVKQMSDKGCNENSPTKEQEEATKTYIIMPELIDGISNQKTIIAPS